jgi:hypothetical protein
MAKHISFALSIREVYRHWPDGAYKLYCSPGNVVETSVIAKSKEEITCEKCRSRAYNNKYRASVCECGLWTNGTVSCPGCLRKVNEHLEKLRGEMAAFLATCPCCGAFNMFNGGSDINVAIGGFRTCGNCAPIAQDLFRERIPQYAALEARIMENQKQIQKQIQKGAFFK